MTGLRRAAHSAGRNVPNEVPERRPRDPRLGQCSGMSPDVPTTSADPASAVPERRRCRRSIRPR
jgi:hypothetical protein